MSRRKTTAEDRIRARLQSEPRTEMDVEMLIKDMWAEHGLTRDEVEDAIIRLENKGAVYGTEYGGRTVIGVVQ